MDTYKILVVDDLKDNLITIVDMIEEKKGEWDIFQANNGEQAYEIAINELPDLIIMDWEMPGLSGIETTKKLKQNVKTSDIPVIICTGIMTPSKHIETAFKAGAVDYIRKPIDIIELHLRMQSMLLLSKSYKNIKALNNHKNKMLSIIAHDLKNPIYTVKLLLDLSLKKNLQEERRNKILKSINASIGSTFSLLENLLVWANSQRNKILFSPELFPIKKAIDENIKFLELVAEEKSIELLAFVEENSMVFADYNMILTILRNLISNAIKFSDLSSTVKIKVTDNKDFVKVSIVDSGVGISEENIRKILDDNIHYTTVGTRNEAGSGIGLLLCKEFIEQNKGQFEIKSEVNKGSIFSFTIPSQSENT